MFPGFGGKLRKKWEIAAREVKGIFFVVVLDNRPDLSRLS